MKKISLLPLLALFLIAGCAKSIDTSNPVSFEKMMTNPLYAQRYWEDLTESMVNMQINKDKDITANQQKLATVDATRRDALAKAQAISLLMHDGKVGQFLTVKQDTNGSALLLKKVLYFSPDFTTIPSPSLHLYLTQSIDPRNGQFPDPTSKDLGTLASPYGAQQYPLPPSDTTQYHSAVLYDTVLNRIEGFVQLQ